MLRSSLLFVLPLALAAVAWGAATTAPSAEQTPLPADEMLRQLLQPQPPSTRPITPTSIPTEAALVATPTVLPAAEPVTVLQREGAIVADRAGQLAKPVDGPLRQFVFSGGDPALPDMYVLPNLQLMDMETQLDANTRPLVFVVAGTITEYRGHNYLLLDSGPQSTPRNAATGLPRPSTTQPVSADQVVQQLIAGAGPKPPANDADAAPVSRQRHAVMVDDKSGPGAVAPGAALLSVIREGTRIFDRVGRLTRHGPGRLDEFTFDADRAAMQDPPVLLLPNLKLVAMENAVSATSKDQRFRVSGMITEYRGRNYLLLEKAQAIADLNLLF